MALITFIPLTILAAMSIFGDTFDIRLGYVGGILCAITVFCTAMIYASLRTVPQWHTAWTPTIYLLFSLTSGTILYLAFFGYGPGTESNRIWVWLALVFLIVAWAAKLVWARRASAIGYGQSDMASATGLGHLGKIRLLERPHSMENYLTREMAFRIARKHIDALRVVTIVTGFALPFLLLFASLFLPIPLLQWLAAASLMLGLFVERWLFFATAKHAVGLYYGGEDALVPAE